MKTELQLSSKTLQHFKPEEAWRFCHTRNADHIQFFEWSRIEHTEYTYWSLLYRDLSNYPNRSSLKEEAYLRVKEIFYLWGTSEFT